MGSELSYIDQSIIKLLDKLAAHYIGYDSRRTELVADDWCQALCIYSDQVLKKAYSEVVTTFAKRPSLAEFVATCEKVVAGNKRSFVGQAERKLTEQEHMEWIRTNFGEREVLRYKAIAAEQAIAKLNPDTHKAYKDNLLKKLSSFCREVAYKKR